MGMVVAVDALLNRRDVAAEHAEWRAWYDHISDCICAIAGVTTEGELFSSTLWVLVCAGPVQTPVDNYKQPLCVM